MKKRAIFLDRDGVLNRAIVKNGKPFPPATLEELELLPGVQKACKSLKEAGFLLIVVTNQPDVGRGLQKQSTVEGMHSALRRMLPIDWIEVCYDSGRGELSEYRKPAPGMLLRTARELDIDLKASCMVGDRWSDISCAKAAGCYSVFLDYGYAEELSEQPDARAASLLEAASLILRHFSLL